MMRLSLNYNGARRRGAGRTRRFPAAMPALLAAALCAATTVPGEGPTGVTRARHLMGTRLTIEIAVPAPAEAFEAAFEEVARLEEIMSNWRDASEVSRLNREAATGWFRCSPDLFAALESALRWARRTGGAFDPTVEPLVRRLGIRRAEGLLPGTTPPPASATGPVGWRHVRLRRAARAARFDAAGVGIDLGGIGKGIALDRAAAVLKQRGVQVALLDFGGQVLAIGPGPRGGDWKVGLADPLDRERPVATVPLRDASLSTSANGGRQPEGSDGPPRHILDPGRGGPAVFAGSVTVKAPDGTTADALSTGLLVMGAERGVTWAREHGFEVLYLWHDDHGALRRRATPWFEKRLSQQPLHGRGAVTLR